MGASSAREDVAVLRGESPLGEALFLSGFTIVAGAFSVVSLATIGFAVGIGLGPMTLVAGWSVGTGVGLAAGWSRGSGVRRALSMALVAGVVLVVALTVSTRFLDVTADGQYYHQEAIIDLTGGWNPLREAPPDSPARVWVQHYPKASWILGASAYALTGHVESGKAFHVVFFVASLAQALSTLLLVGAGRWRAMWVAALVALNPVTSAQLLGGYVDGELASLLFWGVGLAVSERVAPSSWHRLGLVFVTALATNIKFTGGPYAVMLCGGLVALLCLERRWRDATRVAFALGGGLVIGVTGLGCNPYLTNAVGYGHPLHPVAGQYAMDFMPGSTPADFQTMGRAVAMVVSIFSRSENITTPDRSRLKWPFRVTSAEIEASSIPDARVGGFGPLGGGVALLTLALIGALLARPPSLRRPWLWGAALLTTTAAINPYAWWARYVPQLWLVPVAVILASTADHSRIAAWLRAALLVCLSLDAGIVAASSVEGAREGTDNVRRQIDLLKRCRRPVVVYFSAFTSARVRFHEEGLEFLEVDEPAHLPCTNHFLIDAFAGLICEACPSEARGDSAAGEEEPRSLAFVESALRRPPIVRR